MASFHEHITQAKQNLEFLESINSRVEDFWDWKVTASFYIGVHLINAHIVYKINAHYRSHEQVSEAINPHNLSPTKLSEDLYVAYIKLQNLSRRARYLCHDNPKNKDYKGFFTFEKHFSKAIKNLHKLMEFMESEYDVSFNQYSIKCIDLKSFESKFFDITY